MSITEAVLVPLLGTGAPRPLITHYDDATGARVELSRATTANWAAKTANWLVDELDLEPGAPVYVDLPPHWQTAGVLLGSWWCGAHVVDDASTAEVAFVPVGSTSTARTTAVVGLDPLGAPVRDLPDGAVDYVSEIRVHGDDFRPLLPIDDTEPALLGASVEDVVERTKARAGDLGIEQGARVLSTLDWDLRSGVIDGLLAVLAQGGSLVQCSNLDPATLPDRRAAERTTAELGVHDRSH